jgi:shikimate kinase
MAPIVVLVGAPGSGKSTIGKLLAEKLDAKFIDIDEEIEKSSQKTISEIFIEDGEDEFRKLEKAQIAKTLANEDAVVSLGGGAVLNPDTRQLLKSHKTLWLQVSSNVAANRVGLAQARPVLVGNVRAKLVELLKARTKLYEEVAKYQVDTNEKSTEEILVEVLALVQK